MKKRYGSKIYFYVGNKESLKYLEQTCPDGFYDGAMVYDFQRNEYRVDDPSHIPDIVANALDWESYLGCTYQEIIVMHRQYGRGYALGAPFYPTSYRSKNSSHYDILNYYNREFTFWKNEFLEKGTTLFLTPLRVHYALCKKMNIPVRELVVAKFEDYFFWAQSVDAQNIYLNAAYESLKDTQFQPVNLNRGITYDDVNRQKTFAVKSELIIFLKSALRRSFERIMHYIKKDEARFGNHVLSSLYVHYRQIKNKKRLLSKSFVTSFDTIKQRDYFYFPLQHEPELSLQGRSQDFMSQLWAIVLCAKALPANAFLVVKENIYPIGMRPRDFYDQIKALKNVMIAPLDVYGLDLIRHSRGVCTITGTSGYEAAMMGKPAIVLSTHCDYDFLDHVLHCPRGDYLREAMQSVMKNEYCQNKSMQDGSRLIEAIKKTSFRLENFSLAARDKISEHDIASAVDNLENSLKQRLV
jgi:hypothetical protein